MTVCATCYPFNAVQKTFSTVYLQSYDVVAPMLSELMFGIVSIVMVYGLITALWRPGNFIFEQFTRNIVLWIMISTLLTSAPGWWTFFHAISEIGPWLGMKLISQYSNVVITQSGYLGMLESIEYGYYAKLGDAYMIWAEEISVFNQLIVWGGSILLGAVFLIVSYQLFSGIILGYLKIVAIGILSPFIVFFFAFDITRSISIAAVRVLLEATLSLFMACVVTAAMLFLFQQMQADFDLTKASKYISSMDRFLSVFLTGVIMMLVHSAFMEVIGQIMLTFGGTAKAHWGGMVSRLMGRG